MSLGSAYEEEAITALANSAATPRAAPPAKFSAWSAVPRALAVAAGEVGATASDAWGAFTAMRDASPEQRRQMSRTGAPLESFRSDLGDTVRDYWRDYRPDPVTASTAEQVIFGFTRGAAKVIGGALIAGPAGVVAAGVEEGVTQSDELRRQGVDLQTRAQAGAVQGAGLALAALPAAGQTAAATAGLFAVGGPGGFIAQQAATRQILENAGYDQIAAQYDPFDPVGLTVATLLPAGFAAYGLRQARLQRAVQTATLPEPVAPVVEASAPIPSRETPIAAAARAYPTEVVDAARVALLVERRAAANPGAPDNLRAMDLHEAAMARAEEQIAAGETVRVADVAPARAAADGLTFAQRLDAAIAERGYAVSAGDRSFAGGSPGARVISIADMPEAEFMARHGNPVEDVKAHEFAHAWWAGATGLPNFRDPRNKPLLSDLRAVSREFRPTVWETHKAHANKPDELLADGMAFWLKNPARRAEFPQLDKMMRSYDAGSLLRQFPDAQPFDTWVADATAAIRDLQTRTDAPTTPQAANPEGPTPPRGAGAGDAAPSAADAGRPAANLQAAGLTPAEGATIVADALRPVAPSVVDQIDSLLGRRATADAASADSTMARRVEMAQQQFPALEVMVDGMDKPMPLAEFMAAAKAEADDLAADAPLVQAAAECALLHGF